MYTPWRREPGQLTKWLRNRETEAELPVGEDTYMLLWCIAKGYLLISQYKKAEKILKPLIPFLKEHGRGRLLAEAYLLQAVISWETDRRGHALQNIIESFYISGEARYVMLYSNYQKRAQEVLEAYETWHQQTSPEGWTNKKKYPYGNVLQMPMADYLSVIMRGIRKGTRAVQALQTGNGGAAEERLTMMETLVLQEISRGLTNVEICKSQNLKMPTVKTHIYSLYKKLGVNSRVQATIKGKELGILE
jgi:DNA-binding CsgD family transcriptional regulator